MRFLCVSLSTDNTSDIKEIHTLFMITSRSSSMAAVINICVANYCDKLITLMI